MQRIKVNQEKSSPLLEALKLLVILAAVIAWYCFPSSDPETTTPAPATAFSLRPRQSPDGVFYLLDYLTVRTAHGITGWTPGQRLTLAPGTAPVAGKVVVTDGTLVAAVTPVVLTHDMDLARALQTGDRQSQATMEAEAIQTRTNLMQQQLAAQVYAARDVETASAPQVAGNTAGNPASGLSDAADGHGSAGGAVYYPVPVYYNSARSKSAASTPTPLSPTAASSVRQGAIRTVPASAIARPATRPQKPVMSSLSVRAVADSGARNSVVSLGQ